MLTEALSGGFENPPVENAQAFRSIMQAMARPGTIHQTGGAVPPAPASVAAGAVILTLCDATTPLHLAGAFDTQAMHDWVTFHTGAPLVGARHAQFVLCGWGDVALETLPIGVAEYPDRSATVIVERDSLTPTGATLRGPGIKDTAALNLPETEVFQRNNALYPLGLDFVFTCGAALAALPRSTEVR